MRILALAGAALAVAAAIVYASLAYLWLSQSPGDLDQRVGAAQMGNALLATGVACLGAAAALRRQAASRPRGTPSIVAGPSAPATLATPAAPPPPAAPHAPPVPARHNDGITWPRRKA